VAQQSAVAVYSRRVPIRSSENSEIQGAGSAIHQTKLFRAKCIGKI
jgi:hypothetical protein